MKTPRSRPVLLVFICFLLVRTGLYAQEEQQELPQEQQEEVKETTREYKPREQKLYVDIPLLLGEITVINIIGNINWRLWGADSETAYITTESMRKNLDPRDWHNWNFEDGRGRDTFLVNQFFHPYAGGMYFATARSNNLNFYWSILSPVVGSFTWESLCEIDSPSANDFITTAVSGIAIGEMMHRLYLEFDKGGIVGKIGSTILSPTDRLTAAVRGYGPEKGPSKIRGFSLAFGASWINGMFFDGDERTALWNTPAAFTDIDLVYGDPFTTYSKTPFDQFDVNMALTATVPLLYNFTLVTDGYLASWLLVDDETNQASNGLTLHFDAFVVDKGAIIALNNGRENLDYNANSLDYSIKWRHIVSKSFDFSLKTHIGFSPWAITDYNGGVTRDDNNQYLWGGNAKLFMELRQTKENGAKNGQVLNLNLCFYDAWNIPRTPGLDVNMFFLFSRLAYSLPLTDRLFLYMADSFIFLHCRLTSDMGEEFPDITRWYNSAQFGIKILL